MPPDRGQQLLNEQSQQSSADQGQVEVVDHEQCVELERRTVLHELATSEDDDIVGHEHDTRRLDGREGGHTAAELELAGGIAHDILERLVEDGPELDAKRPINRRTVVLQELERHYEAGLMPLF